jgi:hypothetical protein
LRAPLLFAAGLALALLAPADGAPAGNRVVIGRGTFPRWVAVSTPTPVPLRWLTALPSRQIAALDREGTLWVHEVGPRGLVLVARYGDVASPDAPPVAVLLDADRTGLALVAQDGRLALRVDGSLRSHDVGAPLSLLGPPVPVRVPGALAETLLAVAADGAVVLVGGLDAGPKVLARAEVRALPDARISAVDLDAEGGLDAVILTDPSDRRPHGAMGDRQEATSVTVLQVRAGSLAVRGRYTAPAPVVMEDLGVLTAPILPRTRPVVLIARSTPDRGTALLALALRDGRLVPVAESPPASEGNRWIHPVGVADLYGADGAEVVAVRSPHFGGVLTAYRLRGTSLVPVAQTGSIAYGSHALGSRNLEQAWVADLNGNGRPEVVLPRQSRETVAGLELQGERFVERWSLGLRSPLQSNLLIADLDGDGLLDLALADRGGLHVYLSVPRPGGER